MARYREGLVLDEFDEQCQSIRDFRWPFARVWRTAGPAAGSPECATTRALSRLRRTVELVAALPEDRKLIYPWLGVEWIEDDFDTAHNRDQIGRTEDVHYGTTLRADVGLATSALGSDRNAAVFGLSASTGRRLGELDSVFVGSG